MIRLWPNVGWSLRERTGDHFRFGFLDAWEVAPGPSKRPVLVDAKRAPEARHRDVGVPTRTRRRAERPNEREPKTTRQSKDVMNECSVAANFEAQKLQPVDLAICSRLVGVLCWILIPCVLFLLHVRFAQAGLLPLVPLTGVLQVCAGGWLEAARCPCACVMNICMRSPACALFSKPRSCGDWFRSCHSTLGASG